MDDFTKTSLTARDIAALGKVENESVTRPDQALGRDQNTIITNKFGSWPNVTFTLDNSAGLADLPFLLMDATSYVDATGAAFATNAEGGIGQFLGTLKTDYDRPTSMSPNLSWQLFDQYGKRVNLAIDSLMLQTDNDPAQFQLPFELVYGVPGDFRRKDISENIEFLQSPQNFSDLMLKGRVNPMIPVDILNSPLITVLAGEIYRVTASFKAINGLPVAGSTAIPYQAIQG